MSKTSDLLVACMLGGKTRWRASVSTTNASCSPASPVPTNATQRIHLENAWYSIANTTAAAYTVDVQVRGAGATVLGTTRQIVAVGAAVSQQLFGLALPHPKLGQKLDVNATPPASSVQMSVNIAGWIEDSNG